MTFTVRYGLDQHDKQVSGHPTIGDVVADPNLRAVLGYGDNVRALVNGVELSNGTQVPEGCTIVLETRANNKAR